MEYLLALGGLLVVVSAIMAAMGYRGREQIVGIDLGTTFSVVALRSHSGRDKDKVTVLPDRITGRLLVPSVVHYSEHGKILVGEAAVAYREDFPQQTIFNAKRFIGRPMQEVSKHAAAHPFRVVANTSRGPDESALEASAGFSIKGNASVPEFWVSPIDVGAQVVRHLMDSVNIYLGYPIHRAVICVPAKFSPRETAATVKAFNGAGIKVMRVLEEPTAAAIAYNLHKSATARHVLVYDIGGGTLDTSLLYMNGQAVNVLGVAGDEQLGGTDFDHRMQSILEAKLKSGATIVEPEGALPRCSRTGLGVPSERAKIALSSVESTEVKCLAEDGKGRSMTVTRTEFQNACKDLFDRAVDPIEKVLEDQQMSRDYIDDIVMVGGASRMPLLRDLIRKYFDGKRLHTEIDPDVTVAYGAANVID